MGTLYNYCHCCFQSNIIRGVINGKAGTHDALPNFLDMLTLSQSRGADYAHPLTLPQLKIFVITPVTLENLLSPLDRPLQIFPKLIKIACRKNWLMNN